jgi:hypothetical protein
VKKLFQSLVSPSLASSTPIAVSTLVALTALTGHTLPAAPGAVLPPRCAEAAPRALENRSDDAVLQRTTPHYHLFVQGSEARADAFAAILEQCWPVFRAYFKAEPFLKEGERLTVRVYKSREDWERGALADHAAPPARAAPAWYCVRTETAYVHGIPSEYDTRAVLIYAACLQFHALAKFKNQDLDWAWYVHGIGESFGVHSWDGERLELARHPQICVTDYPGLALKALGGSGMGVDFWSDEMMRNPYVRWCVVRFAEFGMKGKYRAQFEKLALGYTGSKVSGEDFVRSLGQRKNVSREFRDWLLAEQFPFEVAHGDWEEYGDGRVEARAKPDSLALCCAKEHFQAVEAIVENVRDFGSTGAIVLSYADGENYVLGRIVPPLVMIEWMQKGRVVNTSQLSFGRMEIDNVLVKARRAGHRLFLNVDGKDLDSVEIPDGRLGFAALGKPVTFRQMRAR